MIFVSPNSYKTDGAPKKECSKICREHWYMTFFPTNITQLTGQEMSIKNLTHQIIYKNPSRNILHQAHATCQHLCGVSRMKLILL